MNRCLHCGKVISLDTGEGSECYACIAHRGAQRARTALAAAKAARKPQEEAE